ncbi:MAG: agmatine deiminase family protein [Planctomycetota bacterium]
MGYFRKTACAAVMVALSSGVAWAQPDDSTVPGATTTSPSTDLSGEWNGGGTGGKWKGPGAPGDFTFKAQGGSNYSIRFIANAADYSIQTGEVTAKLSGTKLTITWVPTSGIVGTIGGSTAGAPKKVVYERSADADFDYLELSSGTELPNGVKAPKQLRRLKPTQIDFPAEWELSDEILWGYKDTFAVSRIYRSALAGCAANGEKVKHRFYVTTAHDKNQLSYEFGEDFGTGPEMDLVLWRSFKFGSVWMRDYGPWTVRKKSNGDRVIGDMGYFSDRPDDDRLPYDYATLRGWERLDLSALKIEGGNIQSDGKGRLFTSTRTLEGKSWGANDSQAAVEKNLRKVGATDVVFLERMPEPEGTGHNDMFSKLMNAKDALVGRHSDPRFKGTLDRNAKRFEALGYKVTRVDFARPEKVTGVPKDGLPLMTYTNSLMVGKTCLVTAYKDLERDKAAAEIYKQLGWKPVMIDVRSIIGANGAIHCISMQVPAK